MNRKMTAKKMALSAMLGAMAAVLMYLRTPLPLMPPFMDFDLAGLPEMIGGFAMGPLSAVVIIAVKLMSKLALMGTNSMFTGEIQNFILSCAYVLPAVWVYHRYKSKKGALWGMVLGTLLCAVVAVFTNLYLIIPFYVQLYGYSIEMIIEMCQAVNPLMKDLLSLALFGIIPFNLIKNGIVSWITLLLYKKISRLIKNFIKA